MNLEQVMLNGIKIFVGCVLVELVEKIVVLFGVLFGDVKVMVFFDGEF